MDVNAGKESRRKGRRKIKMSLGQGIVEFVLALPVALMMLLAIIEFGRFSITYIVISSASREAARYGAAVGDYGSESIPFYGDCTGILDTARRIAGTFLQIEESNVSIQYDQGPGTAIYSACPPGSDTVRLGDRIVVQITTRYEPLVPIGIEGIDLVSESKRTIMKNIVVD
jgi:Flp pilus assembly protein TadG